MVILGLVAGMVWGPGEGILSAQEITGSDSIRVRVDIGLGGFWKVGFPTRTVVEVTSGSADVDGLIELQTVDGDGVPVVYQSEAWRVKLSPKSTARLEVIAKHGRSGRPIVVRLVGANGSTIYERPVTSDERGTALPTSQPWVVGLGTDKLNLSQGTMKSTRGSLSEFSTVQLTDVGELPTSSSCYGGVDLLILSSCNKDLNRNMSAVPATAIRDWVAQGGRCLLSLGANVETWLQTAELASLMPGEFKGVGLDCEPGPLESHLGSQNRLANLTCSLFDVNSGTIDLKSKTKARVDFPLIARWAYGAGKTTFLAVELDGQQILDWESRPALLKNLLDDQWEKKDAGTEKRAFLGYDDISGQLNATLDNFPQLTLGNLGLIALLAGLFCLVIGPLDYFLVARRWKRPGATWITLLICSVGSCVFIAGLARSWKPEMPTINSLELLEIDYQTLTLRGRSFAHCYGGSRGSFDFSAHRRTQGLNAKGNEISRSVQLDWFGQPGRGLGGFESTVATDRGMPGYRIRQLSNDASESTNAKKRNAVDSEEAYVIQGVGIPAAGTKSLCATWEESIVLPQETNYLSMVLGSKDLLEGSFENPLGADLLDALLIYRGRAYTLDTRIRVGQKVSFSASTVPKDITRRLQRRQNVGGEERSTPWNPAEANKLDRLMELISFHEAAGGSKYTGLYDRYLSELDCSDVIRLDRAIVICEFKESSLVWSMRRNRLPIQASEGERKTFLRLVIPVSKFKKEAPASGSEKPATSGPKT